MPVEHLVCGKLNLCAGTNRILVPLTDTVTGLVQVNLESGTIYQAPCSKPRNDNITLTVASRVTAIHMRLIIDAPKESRNLKLQYTGDQFGRKTKGLVRFVTQWYLHF